jgi:phosphatidylglycerophosphatase A
LGALPLHFVLRRANPLAHFAVVAGVTALGVWAAQKTAEELGEDDPQSVVIDEVAGVLLALSFVRDKGPLTQALAWGLFRVLDIAKPGPIDTAQNLEPEGVGIMADDVIAGLVAGALARAFSR